MMLRNLLWTLLIGLTLSCTKERNEEFVHGQGGTELLAITDYDQKSFPVETQEQKAESNVSSAQKTDIATKELNVNNFQIVDYKTEAKLAQDIPFRGRPNHQYQVKYTLTNKYLVVNKIGAKEDIPIQEQTYAKETAEGLLEIPVLGYELKGLFKIEKVKDGNNKDTHLLQETKVDTINEATHFKIDPTSKKSFEAIVKQDVFPANMFDGEWFFAVTLVSSKANSQQIIGEDLTLDFQAQSVSRIKFIKSEHSIRAVNLNLDERIDTADVVNLDTAIEIPVEPVDFQIKKDGQEDTLSEELVDNKTLNAKPWDKRKYLKVNFAKSSAITLPSNDNAILDSIELTDSYLSYVLYYPKMAARIKVALSRAHKPKESRVYYKSDRKKFGIFETVKHYVQSPKLHREKDYESLVLRNRFIPNDNKLVFHFTSNSPKDAELRKVGIEAIAQWDKAFKEANTGISVEFNPNDVALGDIRYNSINFIDSVGNDGLLGYGPSIVDSESGEIISATANIYVTPIRDSIIGTLRSYVLSRLGFLNERYIHALNLPLDPVANSSSAESKLKQETLKLNSNGQLSFNDEVLTKDKIRSEMNRRNSLISNSNKSKEKCSVSISIKSIVEDIEQLCKVEMESYINDIKALNDPNATHTDKEMEVLTNCSNKILPKKIMATLLHEMGHNLGLRHNFTASNDVNNFYPADKTNGFVIESASVMDYVNQKHHVLGVAGAYDIAAIRYNYADSILLSDRETILKLDHTKSIEENLAAKKSKMHQYKFCTDHEAVNPTVFGIELGLSDPMCERHDYGKTPLEVVNNIIIDYNAFYASRSAKLDRASSLNSYTFGQSAYLNFFRPLKGFYDQWRYHLGNYVSKNNKYLELYKTKDIAAYRNILKQMSQDPQYAEVYKLYRPAAEAAFNFLKTIAFAPNRYCLVKNENQKHSLIELETLRSKVYNLKGETVNSCNDQESLSYISSQKQTLVKEFGQHYTDFSESLDVENIEESPLYVGNSQIKTLAMNTLTERLPRFYLHIFEDFVPNFMDEPDFRQQVLSEVLERILQGVGVKKLGLEKFFDSEIAEQEKIAKEKNIQIPKDRIDYFLPLYLSESTLINSYLKMFRDGLNVPRKLDVNLTRLIDFSVITTRNPSDLQGFKYTANFGPIHIGANENNNIAKMFVQEFGRLNSLEALKDNQSQPQLSAEEMIKFISESIKLPSEAEAKTFTVEQFIGLLEELLTKIEASNNVALKTGITKLIQAEVMFYNLLVQQLSNAEQAQVEEVFATNVHEFFQGIAQMGPQFANLRFDLTQELLGQKVGNYLNNQNNLKEDLEEYMQNYEQYRAKRELLVDILLEN